MSRARPVIRRSASLIFFKPLPEPTPAIDQPKPDNGAVSKPIVVPPTGPTEVASENKLNVESGDFVLPPLPPLPAGNGAGIVDEPPIRTESVFKVATVNPRFRAALQPKYPPGLIRQEVEGAVTVRVLVGSDGRVKAVEPVRFDDEGFLKVTREQALRKWRFLPATRDGTPFESWREMTVRFEIPG